jgi:hypothetical protein
MRFEQNAMDGSSATGPNALFHLDGNHDYDGLRILDSCFLNGTETYGFFVDGDHNLGPNIDLGAPRIEDSRFENNRVGASLGSESATSISIARNTFSENAVDGLQGGPQNASIAGNVFSTNGRYGLLLTSFGDANPLTGAHNDTITDNCFSTNGFGTACSGGSNDGTPCAGNAQCTGGGTCSAPFAGTGMFFAADQAAGTISTNVAHDNNIYFNFAGATYTGSETINAENNWWGCVTGANTGTCDTASPNIDTDPFLAAPSDTTPCEPLVEATPTPTVTAADSPTPSGTPAIMSTGTPTITATPATTGTPSITVTPSTTATASITATPSPSATPVITATPSGTATPSATATASATATPSNTGTPSTTATPAITATPAVTATPSVTVTPSTTSTSTTTASVAATPTATSTSAPTATTTGTAAPTATATATVIVTGTTTPTASSTSTATTTPTATITPTGTATPVPTGPTPTPGPLDHFQCYETHRPPRRITGISLVDHFGSSIVHLKRMKRFCAPADKNDEDDTAPLDPDHLAAFTIKQDSPRFTPIRDVVVANQFGTVDLDLVRPEALLVPSAKSLVGPVGSYAAAIDHYKCYKARGRFRSGPLHIEDQFGSIDAAIKRPVRLCAPVDKNGEGITDANTHLLCYQVRSAAGAPTHDTLYTLNQFGPDAFNVFGPRELCVPSTLQ